MADDQRDRPERLPSECYCTEQVRISTAEGHDNALLRAALNERLRRGWKLVSMIRAPSGDGVELTWDTSGC